KGENGDKVRVWSDREKRNEILFDGTSNKFVAPSKKVEVFIEGVKPSDKTDDVELFANYDNKDDQKAAVKLTVLWVDTLDFKVTNADSGDHKFVPSDNFNPRTLEIDPKDGHTGFHIYKSAGGGPGGRIGQGIQLKGHVMPPDFAPPAN